MTTLRVYWDQILVDTSQPAPFSLDDDRAAAARRSAGADSRRRAAPTARSRSATTTRACRPFAPWKLMPGRYTREGDVRPLLSAIDDRFVIAAPGDEIALSFDAAERAASAGRLDDDVSPVRRWVQQGDEPALGQPRSGRAAAVSRDERLSVSRVRTVSGLAGASAVPRDLQHARDRAAAAASRDLRDAGCKTSEVGTHVSPARQAEPCQRELS